MTFTLALSSTATVGTPLSIGTTCMFAYGTDALNNPSTDPPIRSNPALLANNKTTTTVTPSVVRLTMSGATTVTGPNWPVAYEIDVDVASGANIDASVINDTLDNRFQVTAYQLPAGATISPSSPPITPGGTFTINL